MTAYTLVKTLGLWKNLDQCEVLSQLADALLLWAVLPTQALGTSCFTITS